jgi:hypothetical protein
MIEDGLEPIVIGDCTVAWENDQSTQDTIWPRDEFRTTASCIALVGLRTHLKVHSCSNSSYPFSII